MLNYALAQFSGLSEILAPVGGPQQKLYLAIQHARNDEAQQIIYSGGCDFSGNCESGLFSFLFYHFLLRKKKYLHFRVNIACIIIRLRSYSRCLQIQ